MRNLKRALSLLLSSTMVLGMMVMGGSAAGYQDVDASNDNREAIEVLQAVGIMSGIDDAGNFGPDQSVTRNQMAVIMAHLLNLDYDYYRGTNTFSDVPDWAAPYVAACVAEGVTAGIGNGLYGGENKVTAAQASLMIMKALGYFQNQEDFGDDWQVATVRQASYINMFDKVNSSAESALNRAQVAQLVLNGLKSDMVTFTGDKGIQIGDVTVGYRAEYTSRTNAAVKYNTIVGDHTDIAENEQYYIQLGEELYEGELKLDSLTMDAFGRPTRTWTYKENKVGSYVKDELLYKEYTTDITGKDLYELLGSNVRSKYTFHIAVDGETDRDILNAHGNDYYFTANQIAKTYDSTVGGTGKGVLTQVYVDTRNEIVNIAVINTYLAKATEAYDEKNDDLELDVYAITDTGHTGHYVKEFNGADRIEDKDDMTVSGEDFDIAEVAEGDLFLVTVADGEIQTMTAPEVLAGSVVSSFRLNKYVVSDGTQYDFASTAEYDSETLYNWTGYATESNLKDLTYDIILDPYGYAIGVKLVENPSQYVFLTGMDLNDSYLSARNADANVIFTDGTMDTVTVNLRDSRGLDVNGDPDANGTLLNDANGLYAANGKGGSISYGQLNTWCTYTVDANGVYTLRRVPTDTADANGNFYKAMQKAQDATGTPVEINKSHVGLDGAGASGATFNRVWGNDETIYINVDAVMDLIDVDNPAGADKITIIDDVDSVVVGAANADMLVTDLGSVTGDDWATGNQFANEIYTLHDDDGYVIASVVIGEDQGSTANYAYITGPVIQESYPANGGTRAADSADQWTWKRPAIVNGEAVELTEVGDSLTWLGGLVTGQWYEVRYDANGNVRRISSALNFQTGSYVPGAANKDLIGDINLIQDAIDAGNDTLLYFQDFTTLDGTSNLATDLSFAGNTLFIDTNGNGDVGFSVSPDVKVVLSLADKAHAPFDKIDDSYKGADGLRKALRNMDTEPEDSNNDGLEEYTLDGRLSFVMEDGRITSIVLNDYTGPKDNTVSAAAPVVNVTASSATPVVGETVTLTADVSNEADCGTLTYKWYKGSIADANLVGTGKTYTYTAGTVDVAVTYICEVTNRDTSADITGSIESKGNDSVTVTPGASTMTVLVWFTTDGENKLPGVAPVAVSCKAEADNQYVAKLDVSEIPLPANYFVKDSDKYITFKANETVEQLVTIGLIELDEGIDLEIPDGVTVNSGDKEQSDPDNPLDTPATVIRCTLTDENMTASGLYGFGEGVESVSFYVSGNEMVVSYSSTSKIAEILTADGFGGYFMLKDSAGDLIAYVVFE